MLARRFSLAANVPSDLYDTAPIHNLTVGSAWSPVVIRALLRDVAYAQRNELTDAVQALYGILSAFGGVDVALPVGIMLPFPSNTAPSGWLPCDGSEVLIADYPDLATVLGNTFGTPSTADYVVLPDMRGRVPGGSGQGSGLQNRAIGDHVGSETHQSSIDEMPIHGHRMRADEGSTGVFKIPRIFYSDGTYIDTNAFTHSEGGDQPHNNMQPTLFVNWIIYGGA